MKKNLRLIVLGVAAVIVGGGLTLAYNAWRKPVSGGQNSDNFFARSEKARIYASFDPNTERRFVRLTRENANGWFMTFSEPIQSFERYQDANPSRPTAARKTIVLQPLGNWKPDEAQLLEPLRAYCADFFQLPARIAPPLPLDSVSGSSRPSGYLPGRTQYDAGVVLHQFLRPKLPADAVAYLGVTMEDLKNADLSFVFGLGSWDEHVGVYSLARYFPKKRIGPLTQLDRKRALRRSMQVLNHETGHILGLGHCTVYRCSMNGIISLPDADRTPLEYCPLCQQKLAWNIGYSSALRTKKLEAFYKKESLENGLLATPSE